ncbi:hypothetical protein [Kitasatospora azatica]|uniref:hypothetical protein n=1 Tax=Kitasatospora azatica TaxID=58347 RepID=UPI00056935FC|nr:hypothetical protein [Kitasatospora azatica]
MPTALLMGSSMAPNLAAAAGSTSTACAPDSQTTVTQVPKSQLTPVPAPSTAATATPSKAAAPTSAPTKAATAAPTAAPTKAAANGTGQAVSATLGTPPQAPAGVSPLQAASTVTNQVVQASAVQPGTTQSQDLIGDILGGIAGIFDPNHQNQQTPQSTPAPAAPQVGAPVTPSTAAPSGSPSAAPSAKPTAAPTGAPTTAAPTPGAPAPSSAPGAAAGGSASAAPSSAPSGSSSVAPSGAASPSAGATASPTATASPSAVASALANGDARPLCAVDASGLKPAGVLGGQVVPDQSWTLHTSRLSLYGAVFGGVYEVHSPTRTYRVLKFTVSSVDIENLDMSTIENTATGKNPAQTFHVKGAPGSTSTMRQGPIIMYVESLSGDLASLYGIPLPDLGAITLTPDTLPQWLYNLIGSVPIPIDMALTKVKAVQAGQFGGNLHIPGMHMYNDDTPYDGL